MAHNWPQPLLLSIEGIVSMYVSVWVYEFCDCKSECMCFWMNVNMCMCNLLVYNFVYVSVCINMLVYEFVSVFFCKHVFMSM